MVHYLCLESEVHHTHNILFSFQLNREGGEISVSFKSEQMFAFKATSRWMNKLSKLRKIQNDIKMRRVLINASHLLTHHEW